VSASRPGFPGGIRLPLHPARTRDEPIRQMAFAPLLSLPLPVTAQPVVREGQDVERGSLLARAGDAGSLPLYAAASGRIQRIGTRPGANRTLDRVIQLAPFPGSTQECTGGPGCDPERATPNDIMVAIRAAGIVVPESGEPLISRLSPGAEPPLRLLLINAIASDAFITRSYRILREQAAEIALGMRYLRRATGAERMILALEEPDADAADALIAAAPAELGLEVRMLPARYPQGLEPLLLASVLAKPLRADAGPPDEAALCLDVAVLAEIGRLLPQGLVCTDVVLSLEGAALDDPGNYRVPLGTPLRFALQRAGLRSEVGRVLDGGLLRGQALASLDLPVTQRMRGLLALARSETGAEPPAAPCIRCGDCLDACPVQLNPAEMGLLARKGEWQALGESQQLERCIECGCCAYVCPSRIPLVQLFRAGKARLAAAPSADLVT
jgi:Na+-translocating ferredoxin:NAD+ oxidoreductase subunit C